MLNDQELEKWFSKNQIPLQARVVINEIRNSEPHRRVQSGKGNVSGFYPSRKMGMTIQFESHKVELPAVYEMEYSSSVLEYYDQPKPVFMEYLSKNGRKISVNSTPDYFLIREDGAAWEEWKTEEQLIKLAVESPNRYVKDDEGKWRCPPGEKYAAKFGMKFHLRSSKEINWIFQRNITFLEDYLKNSYKDKVSHLKIQVVRDILTSQFAITLEEILDNNSIFLAEDLYIMLAQGNFYTDLHKYPLIEPTKVPLFLNKEMADIYENIIQQSESKTESNVKVGRLNQGSKLLWNNEPYTILNVGSNLITMVNKSDEMVNLSEQNFRKLLETNVIIILETIDNKIPEKDHKLTLLEGASRRDIEEANQRYQILKEFRSGKFSSNYSERTLRRWEKSFKEAQKLYGNGFLGLLPKKKNRGNRVPKIESKVETLIKEVISNYYLSNKQMNMRTTYNILEEDCVRNNVSCPSYVTFTKHIANISSHTSAFHRKGKRAAYQFQHWHLEINTPKHGDRPFEIGHIDHTELDVELVINDGNKKITYRPYLTLLVDAFSRCILAHYLTFDPPSFRSNMMILRECVRKHNRLPQSIVVDGGKEFHSTYFESLLAQFEVIKKVRPPAEARFGSVIERIFGTTNTKFIHNLQGNTQLTKEFRIVTKSVNPKNNALWTLPQLDEIFYQWIEYYHAQIHSRLGNSPKEQFDYGMSIGGHRMLNIIPYDESFILTTLPPTPRGRGLIQAGKGVVYNNIWYWNDEFKLCEKQKVDLKYDPYDVGILYAYINKRWVKCISEYHYLLKGKTHKELQMVTEEIRYKLNNKKKITSKEIATFIRTIADSEKIINQSLKDKQNLKIKNNEIINTNEEDITETSITNTLDLNNIPKFDIVND